MARDILDDLIEAMQMGAGELAEACHAEIARLRAELAAKSAQFVQANGCLGLMHAYPVDAYRY